MSMYSLLRSRTTSPTEEQIEESLSGNLCRCTGYRPIIDAFRVFAKTDDELYTKKSSINTPEGAYICPSTGEPCSCGGKNVSSDVEAASCGHVSYDNTGICSETDKELIFPPELLTRKILPLSLSGFGGLRWFRPTMLQQVLDLKSRYPNAKLVVGNTEVGIDMKFKNLQYKVLISVSHVPELNTLSVKEEGLEIGAAVRLTVLQETLRNVIVERDIHQTSACKAIVEQLKWFAGKQIRNVSSIGGNICNASPISDLNPLWIAAGAMFQVIDGKGNVRAMMAKDFFLSYRKVDLAANEILLSVFLPWTRPFEFVKEFKQAHRRDDDIAIVNAGMRVFLEQEDGAWVVSDASLVYGGVAPVSFSASETEAFIKGKIWDQKLLSSVLRSLTKDISLSEDAPGGMIEFRQSLSLSFFFKFFVWVSCQMEMKHTCMDLLPSHLSAIKPYSRPPSCACQDYELVKHGTAVGSPEIHLSSTLQVKIVYSDLSDES